MKERNAQLLVLMMEFDKLIHKADASPPQKNDVGLVKEANNLTRRAFKLVQQGRLPEACMVDIVAIQDQLILYLKERKESRLRLPAIAKKLGRTKKSAGSHA